jgi:hypothetical protein
MAETGRSAEKLKEQARRAQFLDSFAAFDVPTFSHCQEA